MEKTETKPKLLGGIIPMWFVWLAGIGIVGAIVWYAFIRVPKYGKDVKVEDNDGDGKPDDFNPGPYTDKLEADLIGIAVTPHDHSLHAEILAMSDGKIRAIYDDWKKRVSPKIKGESLPKSIADESGFWDGNFAYYQNFWTKRFNSLNLT